MWQSVPRCHSPIDFFRCGGVLADMNCSMMAWVAIPSAFMASFWSSPRNSTIFQFVGLKTIFWNLTFNVAKDLGFTYFLRRTEWSSPIFSRVGLLVFLYACSVSPLIRELKYLILLSSVSCLGFLRLVWERSLNNSNFPDFQPNVSIVVVSEFNHLEVCWKFSVKFAEKKIWSASNISGVFSLRNCGWLVDQFFCCLLKMFQGSSGNFFLNSCYQVVAIFWVWVFCNLTLINACFRRRFTLRVVLARSLICAKCVPGRLRCESGVALN